MTFHVYTISYSNDLGIGHPEEIATFTHRCHADTFINAYVPTIRPGVLVIITGSKIMASQLTGAKKP